MGCRSFHTLNRSLSDGFMKKTFYSTEGGRAFPAVPEPNPESLAQSQWLARERPAFVQTPSYYQPSRCGLSLQSLLTKPITGTWKEGEMYVPPDYRHIRATTSREFMSYYETPDIDPKLLALAEETRKKVRYAEPPQDDKEEKKEPPITLAKKLSDEITQRMIKRAREGIDESSPTRGVPFPLVGRTKLSLLKKPDSPMDFSKATFMTDTTAFARKKKKSEKKKVICSGCSGVKEAEKEAECPTPKSFLDCKVRPAGKCRGPTRKLKAGEPEPNNPYYRNKAKPYSICNRPRPVPKKEERPYKMPCEDNHNKRKFHTSAFKNEAAPTFTTLCDIMKSRGISAHNKNPNSRANAWDSHTPESYAERDMKGYDSVPDLGKITNEDLKPVAVKCNSFSSMPLRKQTMMKFNPENDMDQNDSFTADIAFNANSKVHDWGIDQDPPIYEKTESLPSRESSESKMESTAPKNTAIKPERIDFNIWETPQANKPKSDKNRALPSDEIKKQEFTKNSRDFDSHRVWSSNASQNFSSASGKSEDRPTKLSALFKPPATNKHKTDFETSLKEKCATRITLARSAVD